MAYRKFLCSNFWKILTDPLIFCTLLIISNICCKNTITNPIISGDYSLCYEKSYNNYLEILLNNINGTQPKNISNNQNEQGGCIWSPDGKTIAFWRADNNIRHLYLYDTYLNRLVGLLTSDTSETQPVLWTNDSKRIIYVNGSHINGSVNYCIIDLDGNNNSLLKYPVDYLYSDGYNTLYTTPGSKGVQVYHSNLNGTINEFIVDLGMYVHTNSGAVSISDFNPNMNELLLSFDDPSTIMPNMIATYNINSKYLDTLFVADPGWKCYRPKFSSDFEKVALVERHVAEDTTFGETSRISIIESGAKTKLLEFRDKITFLDFNPMAFSKDDKYLAFVKDVVQPGYMVWWKSYLYVIELDSNKETYIDEGRIPIWNPSKPH